ncbi:hypothetical protein [Nocardioides sp. Iso805N]|uniref:hypothetical protein n=1 Tax=Nocardioides sp. Iso805N TaxID=1283287 RepID=UPI00037BC09D|nr:hypothetical protein [Nocardioides sp. Iso805N]
MTTVVVAGLMVMVAWCAGALVLAAGVGRALARRAETEPAAAAAGIPDGSWLVRPAQSVEDLLPERRPTAY